MADLPPPKIITVKEPEMRSSTKKITKKKLQKKVNAY